MEINKIQLQIMSDGNEFIVRIHGHEGAGVESFPDAHKASIYIHGLMKSKCFNNTCSCVAKEPVND